MMQTFERGFKSWAERISLSLRRDLGLPSHAALAPAHLADYLDVHLKTPNDIPGLPMDVVDQLLSSDPWGWSAVSVFVEDSAVVIYNPRHSAGRQASDIMHELAHVILDHQPGTMILSQDGGMVMRSYNQKQEDEANWLAWCLLLPREALWQCKRLKLSIPAIAEQYGVTETLVNFRIRLTGIEAQFRAANRRR
jgi:Zn-dependent peptidase ImmA (M78 family)